MLVMIIDDDHMVLEFIGELLASKGINSRRYTSPTQAVLDLKEQRYDAVVTDYMMPGMNGRGVLRVVKGICPEIPVFLITGNMDMSRQEAQDLGFEEVFMKPGEMFNLIEAFDRLKQKAPSTGIKVNANNN
ncbi:MAG: response regulator [Planctomycetes bacterium]|nr:response regulator [Planctomycetota bacterium]